MKETEENSQMALIWMDLLTQSPSEQRVPLPAASVLAELACRRGPLNSCLSDPERE